ncbi:MAG: hypothetical protein BIFFINMI_04061 [Phycisphaerae bacterium]|nr:hypothetical protein [Phycisphaerae bacterium]
MPAGCVVADVGADHALLPVFLVERGVCPRAIAADLNVGPLAAAARRVRERGLDGCIDLRLGDGLSVLTPGEADVLVMAGLGGNTIREALADRPEILAGFKLLILQPMSDAGDLRRWLSANGWRMRDERLVTEEGRIYLVIVAEPGCETSADPFALEVGPRLLGGRDPLLADYLAGLIAQQERMLADLDKARGEAAARKAAAARDHLTRLRAAASRAGA